MADIAQLATLNLAICNAFKAPFGIRRSHNLRLIEKQAEQLSHQAAAYRQAHTAYMIANLKPFESCNLRTALAVLLSQNSLSESQIDTLAGMLKHGSDAKTLAKVLAS